MTTKLNVNRFFDGVFNRPSSCQSRTKCTDINSGTIAPIFDAQRLSFVCQHYVVPPVSILLVTSCPAAISRLVISSFIWITINTVTQRWSLTHVLKKRFKRISPSIAYLNALQTIPLVIFNKRIVASLLHHAPRTVCRRVRFIVRDWTVAIQFVFKASTACTAFTVQATAEHRAQSATFALAAPHGTTLLIQTRIAENSPSTNDLPCQIFHAWGNYGRIGISHVSAPLSDRNVVRAESQLELRSRSLLLQNQLAV